MTGDWELWVSAGTGPLEARRFAALLAELLASVCADAGLSVLAELRDPDERSAIVLLRGDAAAALDGWMGTHALIHDSRKTRAGRHRGHRKRWFVSVQLVPSEAARSVRVDPREVELRFARSGGPGGQHVNTSSTAVQARHRSTGLAVRVSDSRSQAHNRELALERLAAKLREREAETQREQARGQRARRLTITRGQVIALWRLDDRQGLVQSRPIMDA